MITIAELQANILSSQAQILSEGQGLNREVSWVVVSRSRTPIFDNLKGGELVLISMRSLRLLDEELDLSRLFGYLADVGVIAVAIMGEISSTAVATAGELGLTLISLPESTNLAELATNATKFIVDNRQQLQQWNQEVYRQFTELAIDGQGLAMIAERLCSLTGKASLIEDNTFRLRARYVPDSFELTAVAGVGSRSRNGYAPLATPVVAPDTIVSTLRENAPVLRDWLSSKDLKASDPPLHTFENASGLLQLTSPIVSQGQVWGYVSLIGREFSNKHRIAVSRAASACAIERAREVAISAVEDRFQANALDELLDGTFTTPEAVTERAKRLGYNLNLPYNVMAFAFRQHPDRSRKKPLTIMLDGQALELDLPISEGMQRELQRLVEQEASRRSLTTITRVRDDRFVLLFSTGKELANPTEIKKLAKVFLDRFAAHFSDINVTAGLGRYSEGIAGISKCASEAEKAVTMGLRLFGPGSLIYFGDLGVYRLLLSINGNKELREFYQEVLGRLLDHDSRNGGELMQTLEAYFRFRGSPSEMSRRMHLHRNTLLYRLRRIQEITGLDLEDAETGLALHLALRIGEVLGERRHSLPTEWDEE